MHKRKLLKILLMFLFLLILSQLIFCKERENQKPAEDEAGSNIYSYKNYIYGMVEEQKKIPEDNLQRYILDTALHRINITKRNLKDIVRNYWENKRTPAGFIELLNNKKLILISGLGKSYIINTGTLNHSEINTNLDDIIGSFEYSMLSMSVKDIFVDYQPSRGEAIVYVSYIKRSQEELKCYSLAFAEGTYDFESDIIIFTEKLDLAGCLNEWSAFRNTGGRIIKLNNNEYLISVGDFNNLNLPQDMSSPYGKFIIVDFNKSDYTIYSSGHRNPQGIFIDKDGIIYSTEHGPRGGDELNIIKEGKNYGWPDISYGINYEGTLRKEPSDKTKYTMPIYFWSPSIAVSEILIYYGNELPRWKNNFLVSSLMENKLHRLTTNDDKNIILSDESIPIGCRMRDIKTDESGIIYMLCEDPSILRIEIDENDYH